MSETEKNLPESEEQKPQDSSSPEANAAANETAEPEQNTQNQQKTSPRKTSEESPSKKSGEPDETTRKILFALCYVWGILFFLPLILCKDDPRTKLHANQGLVLLLAALVGNVLFGILTLVPYLGTILLSLLNLAIFIFAVLGIVSVITDKNEPLPLLGKIHLIN